METYFCDRLRSCYRDCGRSQKIEPCSISCYRLRSSAIPCDQLRLCDHMETKVLWSAIEMHPIIFRVLSHYSKLVCSIVGTIYVAILRLAKIEHVSNFMEEVAIYKCVYHRNRKDFKDKNKKANCWDKIGQKFNLSPGEAEAKFRNIRTAYGRYQIQNRCFRRFWSWRRRRFMTNRRSKFAYSRISALPRSRCCLFFSYTRVYIWHFRWAKRMATVGSGIVAIIWKQSFLRSSAIVCDLRSAIYDRLRPSAIIWKAAFTVTYSGSSNKEIQREMIFLQCLL